MVLVLAGLAKSIDDMQGMLKRFKIEETGFVFVADKNGLIQLHKDANKVAKAKLDSRLQNGITDSLLTQSKILIYKKSTLMVKQHCGGQPN